MPVHIDPETGAVLLYTEADPNEPQPTIDGDSDEETARVNLSPPDRASHTISSAKTSRAPSEPAKTEK